jgi:RNA polymerase sigma-70 factor, ECF subfamily
MTGAVPAAMAADPETAIRELMHRVAVGRDREAFQLLYLQFGPRVKSVLMRSGADSDVAEDIAQDVMLTLWRKAELYSPEKGNVATWIFTIARNLRIDRLRRQSSKPYEDVTEIDLVSPDAGGEETTFGRERDMRVAEALADLQPDQRTVIELSFIQDLPQSEIAKKLDLPLGTVKSRMRLAYGKLRQRLEDLR